MLYEGEKFLFFQTHIRTREKYDFEFQKIIFVESSDIAEEWEIKKVYILIPFLSTVLVNYKH